jgi:hypothetical protein
VTCTYPALFACMIFIYYPNKSSLWKSIEYARFDDVEVRDFWPYNLSQLEENSDEIDYSRKFKNEIEPDFID